MWLCLQESRTVLLTIGLEAPGQLSSCTLKFWDTATILQHASTSAVQFSCTVRLFAQKLAEADVTSAAFAMEKYPNVRIAVGLASGQIVTMLGSCQGEASLQSDCKPT